jgi:hypothetical protein
MTVLIGVISFVGYRRQAVGYRRGVAVAGMAEVGVIDGRDGAAMSRLAREHPAQIKRFGGGHLRECDDGAQIIAVIAVVNPTLAWRLAAGRCGGVLFALAGSFSCEEASGPQDRAAFLSAIRWI